LVVCFRITLARFASTGFVDLRTSRSDQANVGIIPIVVIAQPDLIAGPLASSVSTINTGLVAFWLRAAGRQIGRQAEVA
jgi:hypothetical protein